MDTVNQEMYNNNKSNNDKNYNKKKHKKLKKHINNKEYTTIYNNCM